MKLLLISLKLQQLDKALDIATKALELAPNNAVLRSHSALVYLCMEKIPEAQQVRNNCRVTYQFQCIDHALKLNPHNSIAKNLSEAIQGIQAGERTIREIREIWGLDW